jgi:hypothetical protein
MPGKSSRIGVAPGGIQALEIFARMLPGAGVTSKEHGVSIQQGWVLERWEDRKTTIAYNFSRYTLHDFFWAVLERFEIAMTMDIHESWSDYEIRTIQNLTGVGFGNLTNGLNHSIPN